MHRVRQPFVEEEFESDGNFDVIAGKACTCDFYREWRTAFAMQNHGLAAVGTGDEPNMLGCERLWPGLVDPNGRLQGDISLCERFFPLPNQLVPSFHTKSQLS